MQKPVVFVGSSSEGLEIAKAVQYQLQGKATVKIWHEGLLELGKGTLEGLIQLLPNYDFAILVATPDDATASRGKKSTSPRDNVLVELGMFVTRLGPHRAFLLRADVANLKIPSDFAGVSHAIYEYELAKDNAITAVGPACTLIGKAFDKHGTLLMSTQEYTDLLGKLTDNDFRALRYLEDTHNARPGDIYEHLATNKPIDLIALDNFAIRVVRLTQYGLLRLVGGTEVEIAPKGKAFLDESRRRREPKYRKLLAKKLGKLEQRVAVNLQLQFDRSYRGCFEHTGTAPKRVLTVRVLPITPYRVKNCFGKLLRISESVDGAAWTLTNYMDPLDLKWTHQPTEANQKPLLVANGLSQTLDVFRIGEKDGVMSPSTYKHPRETPNFTRERWYRFDVKVLGDDGAEADISLKVKRGAAWDDLTVEPIPT